MIENWTKEFIIQRLLAITLLVVLFVLCFQVVQFFIVPALWAAILAYVTFPIYNFFHEKVKLSHMPLDDDLSPEDLEGHYFLDNALLDEALRHMKSTLEHQ